MIQLFLLLSIFTTYTSHALDFPWSKSIALRTCEPVITTACCSAAPIAMKYIAPEAIGCVALASLCLGPYISRFVTQTYKDGECCKDPIETCCPRIRQGNCIPPLGLACKGTLATTCMITSLLLISSSPTLYALFEYVPNHLNVDNGWDCAACEVATPSIFLSHYVCDFCVECLSDSNHNDKLEKED